MPPKPIPVKMERAKHPEIAMRAMAIERDDREPRGKRTSHGRSSLVANDPNRTTALISV